MKILWVRGEMLHPVQSGGQIVSYEIARRLHQRHEIHFVAYERDINVGARERAHEYCTKLYPVDPPGSYHPWRPYILESARAFVSPLPFDARMALTKRMRNAIGELMATERFDAFFCEWLCVTPNLPDLARWVILNHNVESILVERRAAVEPKALVRRYIAIDARRTAQLEHKICRNAAHVLAISELDAAQMKTLYKADRITPVHTGVSADFFSRPVEVPQGPRPDLVFVANMGWLPNVDGTIWFVKEVLPLIRRQLPECTVALVGQRPAPQILELGKQDSQIVVTGTVDDVRPWLWRGSVSIVPIRHGGGVRIKIYEAMAAGIPVVSTSIGAEGLDVTPGEHLLLADDPAAFAEACLRLLSDRQQRARIVVNAERTVRENHTWDRTAREVESALDASRNQRSN